MWNVPPCWPSFLFLWERSGLRGWLFRIGLGMDHSSWFFLASAVPSQSVDSTVKYSRASRNRNNTSYCFIRSNGFPTLACSALPQFSCFSKNFGVSLLLQEEGILAFSKTHCPGQGMLSASAGFLPGRCPVLPPRSIPQFFWTGNVVVTSGGAPRLVTKVRKSYCLCIWTTYWKPPTWTFIPTWWLLVYCSKTSLL